MKCRHNVKPVSANEMYGRGKRFKTPKYLAFQNDIRDELIGVEWPFADGKVDFNVKVGLSNRGADLDNTIKPLLDTYQQVFAEFNDNKVYSISMEKFIVAKGSEYIDVDIAQVKD